jgi:hypothetical protein
VDGVIVAVMSRMKVVQVKGPGAGFESMIANRVRFRAVLAMGA